MELRRALIWQGQGRCVGDGVLFAVPDVPNGTSGDAQFIVFYFEPEFENFTDNTERSREIS